MNESNKHPSEKKKNKSSKNNIFLIAGFVLWIISII